MQGITLEKWGGGGWLVHNTQFHVEPYHAGETSDTSDTETVIGTRNRHGRQRGGINLKLSDQVTKTSNTPLQILTYTCYGIYNMLYKYEGDAIKYNRMDEEGEK